MTELKAGGLAMVLPSSHNNAIIHNDWVGATVLLIRFAPAHSVINDCPDLNDGRPFKHAIDTWLVTDGEIVGTTSPKYLMPLDGDFQHEDEREKGLIDG
ncbi:hypothetical protein QMZ65_03100 [Pantoea sp. EABMAA-21]|uniref:hypothetical protein n=1 Tax=Pantoea sp. EABMAA-21 TaxID=3043302 RepID=UPI0024B5A16A|nr:hypothetical protein [Pantoea sp. EABMAA-21]MDI9276192.1 hypothetical protein [Pantoea sp. EABMAA-21]